MQVEQVANLDDGRILNIRLPAIYLIHLTLKQ